MTEAPSLSSLSFTLNGRSVTVDVDPRETLFDTLRERLRSTGTKGACLEGECGSCTVLLDGEPVTSCLVMALQCDGRDVVTVEGLAEGPQLSALQEAFVRAGAVQCGYCTPGLLVSRDRALAPQSSAERRASAPRTRGQPLPLHGLQQDHRRCARRLARGRRALGDRRRPRVSAHHNIGRSIVRADVRDKVTGETKYGGDLCGPEVLSASVVRAAHAHARVIRVEFSRAKEIPGVVAVLGREDIKGTNRHGLIKRDHPVFCDERVRYRGDAIAMVIATSPEAARLGRDAVQVEYEPLPVIATMADAQAEGATPIHEFGNVLATQLIRKGDVAKALADSDTVSVTRVFDTQGVDHAFLDLEAGYAAMDGDVVTIHASGQWVHEERRLIALALGLPVERVRIVQPPTGGAFGGREDISIQIFLGLAALVLGRPVRIQYTREESMVARHKRHPMQIEYTLAAKRDGTLTAAKVLIRSDEGAYASTGPAVLRKAVSHCTGPYRVPNVEADGVALFTNNCPTGAMRGFGACQLAIAYEGAVLALAKELGIDIIEFKKKNLVRDGDKITTNQVVNVASAIDCLDAALDRFHWNTRRKDDPAPHLRRGYGVSTICFGLGYGDGYPDASRARVRFADDTCSKCTLAASTSVRACTRCSLKSQAKSSASTRPTSA